MSREWKPGDIARTIAGGTIARTATNRWILLDDGFPIDWDDDSYDSRIAHPLVVLDPESTEDVERLTAAYMTNPGIAAVHDLVRGRMAHALRELANPTPPKPDEPTGLGAVVEDAAGEHWVRVTLENLTWPGEVWQDRFATASRWSRWDDIAAVRVLSEGVVPE